MRNFTLQSKNWKPLSVRFQSDKILLSKRQNSFPKTFFLRHSKRRSYLILYRTRLIFQARIVCIRCSIQPQAFRNIKISIKYEFRLFGEFHFFEDIGRTEREIKKSAVRRKKNSLELHFVTVRNEGALTLCSFVNRINTVKSHKISFDCCFCQRNPDVQQQKVFYFVKGMTFSIDCWLKWM